MNELEIIEFALAKLKEVVPESLHRFMALESYTSIYQFESWRQIKKVQINFGELPVTIEELPAEAYAGSHRASHDYRISEILPDGSRLMATFEVFYKFSESDRATLFALGKLKHEVSTYESLQC
jgi:hypothetical protein